MTDKPKRKDYVAYSMGITDADHEKFRTVYEQALVLGMFVLMLQTVIPERFANFVKEFRKLYPT